MYLPIYSRYLGNPGVRWSITQTIGSAGFLLPGLSLTGRSGFTEYLGTSSRQLVGFTGVITLVTYILTYLNPLPSPT